MRVKKRTIVLVGIGVIVLALLFYAYWTNWRFEKVTIIGRKMNYIEGYKDYYYKSERKRVKSFIARSVVVEDIYFLPGQKERMLEKIKEDVMGDVEKVMEEYSDILYKYEVSDDFTRVQFYRVSRDIDESKLSGKSSGIGHRIQSLMGLYHRIQKGRIVSVPDDYSIETIKPPKSMFDYDFDDDAGYSFGGG